MVAKGLDDAGIFGDAGICYEMSEHLQEFSWLDVVTVNGAARMHGLDYCGVTRLGCSGCCMSFGWDSKS